MPSPGTELGELADPNRLVTVPDVEEMRFDSAHTALEQEGLRVITLFDDFELGDPRIGRVVDQTPAAGQLAPYGSEMVIVVGREAP